MQLRRKPAARNPLSSVTSNVLIKPRKTVPVGKKILVAGKQSKPLLTNLVQKHASPPPQKAETRPPQIDEFQDLKSFRFSLGGEAGDVESCCLQDDEEVVSDGSNNEQALHLADARHLFKAIPVSPIQKQPFHEIDDFSILSFPDLPLDEHVTFEEKNVEKEKVEEVVKVVVQESSDDAAAVQSDDSGDLFGLISNYKRLHESIPQTKATTASIPSTFIKNHAASSSSQPSTMPTSSGIGGVKVADLDSSLSEVSSLDSFDFLLAPGQIEDVGKVRESVQKKIYIKPKKSRARKKAAIQQAPSQLASSSF